jgi:prevent-host-death family protein
MYIMDMKKISIQDLKANLSSTVAQAEAGDTIVITRHNTPVATLSPADPSHVHRGHDAGRRGLKPALKPGTRIPYLEVLLDDRRDR